jgi:hypothetical protein
MKFARFAYSTLGLITAGSLAWGCSSKSSDCAANKDCAAFGGVGTSGSAGKSGSSGTSGTSGGGDSGAPSDAGQGGATGTSGGSAGGNAGSGGAACVGSASPDTTDCVIGDDYGLFVSLSGDDSAGDGSEAHPLATVTKALSLTGPNKLNRIYVCATPTPTATAYAEPSTVVIPDRVSIYGGFTCDGGTWAYDTTVAAHLKPASPVGAQIDNAKNGVVLQDLRIDATAAPEDGTGASSFGMIVNASKGVVLTRVEIHAGKGGGGAAGADGLTGADGTLATADQNGKDASCVSAPGSLEGGKWPTEVCGSQGGDGGKALKGTQASGARDGISGLPNGLANNGAGSQSAGLPGGTGQPGQPGTAGALGASAKGIGAFAATGYTTAGGGDGTKGQPGQGGGGGGASFGSANCVGASGAAGGMGGCGGDSGLGGKGGGASIALLSWSSTITLEASTFVATAGGSGGNGGKAHGGGAGAAGGSAGRGDTDNSIGVAGDGGKGGTGGNGGSGAGGTGGPSIALVYSGTEPKGVAGSTLTPGDGGALGTGGHLGLNSANWGPDGQKGLSQAEYEQK